MEFFSHVFSCWYLEQAPQSYPWSYSNPCPIHLMHSAPSASSGLLKELQEDISAALLPGRACHPLGLQGIAITHCTVTQADIKYICDLLEPVTIVRRSSNTPRDRDKEKDKDDSSNSSRDTSSSKNAAGRPRGLRYLDLGFNRMGCANCSEVLRAAARGNLECLDLAGNFSHRGGPFLAAIVETLTANSPVNNLTGRGGGDNDDYSSDGGSDDGNNNSSNYSNSNSSSSSSGGNSKATMKSLCGTQRTPRNTTNSPHDTLSLHLPKHIPLQYTCHLKHLVSTTAQLRMN